MLKRILTVSAALVLMTGVAGTAHADRLLLINKTHRRLCVTATARQFVPTRRNPLDIKFNMKIDQQKDVNFGENRRFERIVIRYPDFPRYYRSKAWNVPSPKDPERAWKIKLRLDEHGSIAYDAVPNDLKHEDNR